MHRVLLINAGSNKNLPSARLTEIDPRDGAAVLGANGVGKTTVLQIIPLFFGYLPGNITAAGQQNMIRFLLPTDGSAIGFEYQRGIEGPESMRLVVMRRRNDDPDNSFYRIFTGPFTKELFVKNGHFLNDEESLERAGELGIKHTKMLTAAEYRHVILKTASMSKDRDKLRKLAYENSFGPRPLDNLDRLVATMVKQAINFEDILQVVVSMVQRDLGQGAERSRISFKQPPSLIKRWLINRLACIEAERIRPEMEVLSASLIEHRNAESRFRNRRADVNAVALARVTEKGVLANEIADLEHRQTILIDGHRVQRRSLDEDFTRAQDAVNAAQTEHDRVKSEATHFQSERAAHWSTRLIELDGLRSQESAIGKQILAAHAGRNEVDQAYSKLADEATASASQVRLTLEEGKSPVADRLQKELAAISESESSVKVEIRAIFDERIQGWEAAREPLIHQQGKWQHRKDEPGVSAASREASGKAQDKLVEHQNKVAEAQTAATLSQNAADAARRDFDDHVTRLNKAKTGLSDAEKVLELAKTKLTPPAGSLLAALRSSESESWKRNLAKIIRPELLARTDLSPHLDDDEAVNLAYGWSLDTGVISADDWVDDQRTKDAVTAAQEKVTAASLQIDALVVAGEAKGKVHKAAQDASLLADGKLAVLKGQAESVATAAKAARQVVEDEVKNGKAIAERELQTISNLLTNLKNEQATAKRKLEVDLDQATELHARQRGAAQLRSQESTKAIDGQIAANEASLKILLADLQRQKDEHLGEKGIDVPKLRALEISQANLVTEIRLLEGKKPLVSLWKEWEEQGGAGRVEALHALRQRAGENVRALMDKKTAFEVASGVAATTMKQSIDAMKKRSDRVDDDLEELQRLDDVFGDYQALGESQIDITISAEELKGKTNAERAALRKLDDKIFKSFVQQRRVLNKDDSDVGALIEASLRSAGGSTIAQADDLCRTYGQIGRQVVTNVNTTLDSILANVYQFQKSIRTFESEVGAFNGKLQKGLNAVHKFERISDISLSIKTNFETLNFYKKFSSMEEVVRDHNNVAVKDPETYIPPASIANALADFANLLDKGGDVDISLSRYITLQGAVTENGQLKQFRNASEFAHVSSGGLTALIGITVMTALLNTIRGDDPIYVPWVTDEIGKFDVANLGGLISMLRENKIDVITASPDLTYEKLPFFARRYLFEDKGRIRKYVSAQTAEAPVVENAPVEVSA